MNRDTYSKIRLLRAPFSLTLNASRDEAYTSTLGNLFQCLTTLTVKSFFIFPGMYRCKCMELKIKMSHIF